MEIVIEKLPRYRDRAMASFIVDDLGAASPEDAQAFIQFSRWVEQAGLKGECSAILGLKRSEGGRALPPHPDYAKEVARAAPYLDAYMEVMTHSFLYDFGGDRIRTDGPHEGAWLHDRSRGAEEYAEYFRGIAQRAREAGFRHAGLTLPGCGCAPCAEFYARNRLRSTAAELNPMVFEALLDLAVGLLASPVCGLFIGSEGEGPADVHVMAERGRRAVYDVPPGIQGDEMGRWDRNPEHLNVDAYITEDGEGGRLAQLLAQGTRTLVYYGHWQSLRPDGGIGFPAFQEVAARLARCYGQAIVWMRPTEIAAYRHTERHTEVRPGEEGRSFRLRIPFEALHPLTFRIAGASDVQIRTPGGQVLSPAGRGACGLLFDLLPESGRYEFV